MFLGEVYIEEVLLGFSLRGFLGIDICVLFCTIIVITCFRDVVPPVSDVINVISQVNF